MFFKYLKNLKEFGGIPADESASYALMKFELGLGDSNIDEIKKCVE